MAATALNVTSTLTSPSVTGNSNGGTPAAGDAGNGNSFANGGVEVLMVDNVGASSRTLAFLDKNGNATGTVTVAANKNQLVGPFDVGIYGATVTFTPSHAELELRVFQLAGGGLTNIITAR